MSKDSKTPLAFPYCGVGDELNYSKGMSLRDYFAAKAMQAIIEQISDWRYSQQPVSDWAYEYADEMLKARQA
jgi:hypothetical protein